MERLALAIVVSAGAHIAVIANAPFAPGLSEFSLFAGRPLTARLAAAPAPLPDSEPLQQRPEPEAEPAPKAAAAPQPAQPPASAAGLPSAEIYYRGSEVDERAVSVNNPDIEYPERPFASGVAGTVRLRLLVDREGALREAKVLEAQPAGVFEEAALKAVRMLIFRPAIRNGIPVGSIKVIEVPFYPDCNRTGSCNQ